MDTKLLTGYPVAMLRMLVVILTALTLNVALLAAAAHSAGVDSWQAVQTKMPEGSTGETSPIYTNALSCTIKGDPETDGTTCDWACSALTAITPDFFTKPSIQPAVKARSLLSALSLNGISPPLQERPPRTGTA